MLSCEFCEISKNNFFTEHRSGRLFLNNEFYNSVGSMVVAFLTSLKVAIWVRRVLLEDEQIIKREDLKKGETQYKREAMVPLCCSVGVGQYVDISYIPIQRSFHYFDAIKWQETLFLHYFLSQ